jgi:hypothetical protein
MPRGGFMGDGWIIAGYVHVYDNCPRKQQD